MDLTKVKTALDGNKVFDSGLKENILELVQVFVQTYPDISLDHLCENLKTLKVEKVSKFVSVMPIDYNAKLNKVTMNVKALEEAEDVKNLLMNIVIRLIVSHDGVIGFDTDGSFIALNLGVIAGMSNMLVGNEAEHDLFADEIIAANIFGKLIGDDVLQEAFFTNNPGLILNQAVNKGD